MKNRFSLSVLAGVSSIALAVPLFASAASTTAVTAKTVKTPTVACVQAMAAQETAQINTMDTETAARKAAMQAHVNALNAAAGISDDTQRAAAIKTANETLSTAMQTAMTNDTTAKTAMDAVRTACGNAMGGMMHGGFGGMTGGKGMMMPKAKIQSSATSGKKATTALKAVKKAVTTAIKTTK